MDKKKMTPLKLNRESLRLLEKGELAQAGGASAVQSNCATILCSGCIGCSAATNC